MSPQLYLGVLQDKKKSKSKGDVKESSAEPAAESSQDKAEGRERRNGKVLVSVFVASGGLW